MDFLGFNANEVNSSIGNIIQAYNNLYNALYIDMQNIFINKLCNDWYGTDAIEFIAKVKTSSDSLLKEVDEIFGSVEQAMNGAAQAWAEETGNIGAYTVRKLSANTGRINTSNAKENNGGIRGMRINVASEARENLAKIKTYADQALTSARKAVEECGFLGGNQASSLQNSLSEIKNNVNKEFGQLSDDLENAIKSYLQSKTDLSETIQTKFSGN